MASANEARRHPHCVGWQWQSGEVDDIAEGTVEAKQALRRTMRRVRGSIPDRPGRSARMWIDVLRLADSIAADSIVAGSNRAIVVLAFVGVGHEPDTDDLLQNLAAAGHSVLLPRVEGEHIVAVLHEPGEALRSGAYGIPEPVGISVEPDVIDLVIVPGLAFTADGRRLGQGGGFYDRFLPLVREDCVTCGVGYAEQIVDDLPLEVHDRLLTMVMTA